jgi:sugar lactone lactonase YvrE
VIRFALIAMLAAFALSPRATSGMPTTPAAPALPQLSVVPRVSPQDAAVFPGATIRFHLRAAGADVAGVRWSLFGPGSLDDDGTYRASAPVGATAQVVAVVDGAATGAAVRVVAVPDASTPIAVVSCYDDGGLDVYDERRLTDLGAASTDGRSGGIVADVKRRLAFVASGDRIATLDMRTGAVAYSSAVAGARFSEVALVEGEEVAATDNNASAGAPGVRIFDVRGRAASSVSQSVDAGETPEGIAASADGSTFYVTNVNGNSLMRFVFDHRGRAELAGIANTGHRPFGVALAEPEGLVFVADNDTPTVSGADSKPGMEEFAAETMRRIARVDTGTGEALPLGVAADPRLNRIFVTNEGDGDVAAYSISPLRKVAVAQTASTPWLPAIDVRRGLLFVPSASANAFAAFDAASLRPVSAPLSTCGYPLSIAVF